MGIDRDVDICTERTFTRYHHQSHFIANRPRIFSDDGCPTLFASSCSQIKSNQISSKHQTVYHFSSGCCLVSQIHLHTMFFISCILVFCLLFVTDRPLIDTVFSLFVSNYFFHSLSLLSLSVADNY